MFIQVRGNKAKEARGYLGVEKGKKTVGSGERTSY